MNINIFIHISQTYWKKILFNNTKEKNKTNKQKN